VDKKVFLFTNNTVFFRQGKGNVGRRGRRGEEKKTAPDPQRGAYPLEAARPKEKMVRGVKKHRLQRKPGKPPPIR